MIVELNKYISERLKEARKEIGYNQVAFKELVELNYQTSVSDYECNRVKNINLNTVYRWAMATKKPMSFFFPDNGFNTVSANDIASLNEKLADMENELDLKNAYIVKLIEEIEFLRGLNE